MGSSEIPAGVAAAIQGFTSKARAVGTQVCWAETAGAVARLLPETAGATDSIVVQLPDLVASRGLPAVMRAGLFVWRRAWLFAELSEAEVCCGFGGTSSLLHPRVSRRIVERKLACLRETDATVVATDNPGCLLHLRGAAHAAGDTFAVRHVAELLAERVASAGSASGEAAGSELLIKLAQRGIQPIQELLDA